MEKEEFFKKLKEMGTFCEKTSSQLEAIAHHLRTAKAGIDEADGAEQHYEFEEFEPAEDMDEIAELMESVKEKIQELEGITDLLTTYIEDITPYSD